MKNTIFVLILIFLMLCTACSSVQTNTSNCTISQSSVSSLDKDKINSVSQTSIINTETDSNNVDIDLTILDSNMVYAQVYDMVYNGDNYLGKKVKVNGTFAYYKDELTENEYFTVLISDATACCAQGIEFILDGEYKYPDDYPELDTKITVIGDFNYYKEGYNIYCQLLNAQLYIEDSPLLSN